MIKSKLLLTTVFGLLIFVPFVGHYAYIGSHNSKVLVSENRVVTQYQELKSFHKKDIKQYFSNLDRYITDRLSKKDSIVKKVNRYLTNPRFFTTLDYSKGVVGKDGFLFLGNSYEQVINRHFGDFEIKNPKNVLLLHSRLSKTAESIGAEYFLFVAPDKHGIYCEKFPDWLKLQSSENLRRITDGIKQKLSAAGVKVVYPFEELRQRRDGSVYFKTDTHWNHLGAEIGFHSLMDNIRSHGKIFSTHDFVSNNDYELIKSDHKNFGDLGYIIGLDDSFKFDDVIYNISTSATVQWSDNGASLSEKSVSVARSRGEVPSWYGEMKNPLAPNKHRLLILCDSFMVAMTPYFNLNFSEIYYSSRHRPVTELEALMKEFKPDLVIYETVERALM